MSSHAGWIIYALLAVFGVAIAGRWRAGRPSPERKPPRPGLGPLKPGESYDTAVKLATLPNGPLADLWCQRLREQGIEAFGKSGASSGVAGIYGGPLMNPGGPTEVWVGEHDVERARELFPELA